MEEAAEVTISLLHPYDGLKILYPPQGRGEGGRKVGWAEVIATLQSYRSHWTGHGRCWSLLWSPTLKYTSLKGDLPSFNSRPAPRPHRWQNPGPLLSTCLLLDWGLGRTWSFEFSKPKVLRSLCWLHFCWLVPALHPWRNAKISGDDLEQTGK